MNVIEPGCGTYYIDDLMFEGDENLVRLTTAQRALELKGLGGSGVGTLRRQGKGWAVTRDVHLGENVAGYTDCAGPPRS
jgi:protocatechuate 3,4-dioxygenase beta subunit